MFGCDWAPVFGVTLRVVGSGLQCLQGPGLGWEIIMKLGTDLVRVVFDDACVVMIDDRAVFDEIVGRIGDSMFRSSVGGEDLPVVSVGRLLDHLMEQTDLLVMHDPAYWLSPPQWEW